MAATHEDAFLAEIIERPDDDAPRLIFADWLEESGAAERAEFIRTQCRLASLPADHPERPALEAREKALLNEHGKVWAAPLKELGFSWRFRRGFVEALGVSGERPFVNELTQAVALAPIRSLTLLAQDINGRHLHAAVVAMTRLKRLQFSYPNFAPGAKQARAFFGRPELCQLTALFLMSDRNGSGLTDEIARAVVTSPALAGLTELTLIQDFQGLPCPIIRELAQSPHMARLERLSLEQSHIDAETIRLLGHSQHLRGLKEVDLGGCCMDRAGWEALLAAPLFAGLQRLYLADASVRNAEGRVEAFVGKPRFQLLSGQQEEAFRAEFLATFGPGVLDFASDSHRRWEEPIR